MPSNQLSARDARVLVVGESLVDVVDSDRGDTSHPGGSPLNVAYGLGRLGVATTLLTEFADDVNGALLSAHLDSAGVTVVRSPHSVTPTSTATASIGIDGAARYEFDVSWTLSSPPKPGADVIHTGSIAAVMQPGADAVAKILLEAEPGTLLSYDPNVRPELMGDRESAVAGMEAIAGLCTVVKLSDEDAAWLYPGASVEWVCDRFLEFGASLVAVTLGAAGCVLATPAHRVAHEAEPTTVVDTIGAGDSFMSALLFGLLREPEVRTDPRRELGPAQLTSLARVALVSAAITVSRSGANPPTLAELETALGRQQ